MSRIIANNSLITKQELNVRNNSNGGIEKQKNIAKEINLLKPSKQRIKELPVQCVARMHLGAKTQTLVHNELFTSGKGDNFKTRTQIKKTSSNGK